MPRVVHFELSVPDPQQAANFYSSVFGWSITKLPDPVQYWQIRAGDPSGEPALPGGIVQSKTASPRTSVTVEVESLDEACARVTSHGGILVTQPQVVAGYGVHVLCRDPQGIVFALIQPTANLDRSRGA